MRSGHIGEKKGLVPLPRIAITARFPAGRLFAIQTELTWPPTATISVFK